MQQCSICFANITRVTKPGLQCSGKCAKYFHDKCANLTPEQFDVIAKTSLTWYCDGCKPKGNRKSIIIPRTVETPKTSHNMDSLLSPAIVTSQPEITNNQLFDKINGIFSQRFDDLNKKIEELIEENIKLKEVNKKNMKTTAVLETKVDQLDAELSIIKQRDFKNDLFVSGIPKEENINLSDLIVKTIALLNMDENISSEHFSSVYKVGPDDKTISAIVSLKDEAVKLRILKAAKSGRAKNIFFNQRLTYYTSQLLKSSTKFRKEHNFKYLWVSDGKILLKKDDDSKTIHIKTQTYLKNFSRNNSK